MGEAGMNAPASRRLCAFAQLYLGEKSDYVDRGEPSLAWLAGGVVNIGSSYPPKATLLCDKAANKSTVVQGG